MDAYGARTQESPFTTKRSSESPAKSSPGSRKVANSKDPRPWKNGDDSALRTSVLLPQNLRDRRRSLSHTSPSPSKDLAMEKAYGAESPDKRTRRRRSLASPDRRTFSSISPQQASQSVNRTRVMDKIPSPQKVNLTYTLDEDGILGTSTRPSHHREPIHTSHEDTCSAARQFTMAKQNPSRKSNYERYEEERQRQLEKQASDTWQVEYFIARNEAAIEQANSLRTDTCAALNDANRLATVIREKANEQLEAERLQRLHGRSSNSREQISAKKMFEDWQPLSSQITRSPTHNADIAHSKKVFEQRSNLIKIVARTPPRISPEERFYTPAANLRKGAEKSHTDDLNDSIRSNDAYGTPSVIDRTGISEQMDRSIYMLNSSLNESRNLMDTYGDELNASIREGDLLDERLNRNTEKLKELFQKHSSPLKRDEFIKKLTESQQFDWKSPPKPFFEMSAPFDPNNRQTLPASHSLPAHSQAPILRSSLPLRPQLSVLDEGSEERSPSRSSAGSDDGPISINSCDNSRSEAPQFDQSIVRSADVTRASALGSLMSAHLTYAENVQRSEVQVERVQEVVRYMEENKVSASYSMSLFDQMLDGIDLDRSQLQVNPFLTAKGKDLQANLGFGIGKTGMTSQPSPFAQPTEIAATTPKSTLATRSRERGNRRSSFRTISPPLDKVMQGEKRAVSEEPRHTAGADQVTQNKLTHEANRQQQTERFYTTQSERRGAVKRLGKDLKDLVKGYKRLADIEYGCNLNLKSALDRQYVDDKHSCQALFAEANALLKQANQTTNSFSSAFATIRSRYLAMIGEVNNRLVNHMERLGRSVEKRQKYDTKYPSERIAPRQSTATERRRDSIAWRIPEKPDDDYFNDHFSISLTSGRRSSSANSERRSSRAPMKIVPAEVATSRELDNEVEQLRVTRDEKWKQAEEIGKRGQQSAHRYSEGTVASLERQIAAYDSYIADKSALLNETSPEKGPKEEAEKESQIAVEKTEIAVQTTARLAMNDKETRSTQVTVPSNDQAVQSSDRKRESETQTMASTVPMTTTGNNTVDESSFDWSALDASLARGWAEEEKEKETVEKQPANQVETENVQPDDFDSTICSDLPSARTPVSSDNLADHNNIDLVEHATLDECSTPRRPHAIEPLDLSHLATESDKEHEQIPAQDDDVSTDASDTSESKDESSDIETPKSPIPDLDSIEHTPVATGSSAGNSEELFAVVKQEQDSSHDISQLSMSVRDFNVLEALANQNNEVGVDTLIQCSEEFLSPGRPSITGLSISETIERIEKKIVKKECDEESDLSCRSPLPSSVDTLDSRVKVEPKSTLTTPTSTPAETRIQESRELMEKSTDVTEMITVDDFVKEERKSVDGTSLGIAESETNLSFHTADQSLVDEKQWLTEDESAASTDTEDFPDSDLGMNVLESVTELATDVTIAEPKTPISEQPDHDKSVTEVSDKIVDDDTENDSERTPRKNEEEPTKPSISPIDISVPTEDQDDEKDYESAVEGGDSSLIEQNIESAENRTFNLDDVSFAVPAIPQFQLDESLMRPLPDIVSDEQMASEREVISPSEETPKAREHQQRFGLRSRSKERRESETKKPTEMKTDDTPEDEESSLKEKEFLSDMDESAVNIPATIQFALDDSLMQSFHFNKSIDTSLANIHPDAKATPTRHQLVESLSTSLSEARSPVTTPRSNASPRRFDTVMPSPGRSPRKASSPRMQLALDVSSNVLEGLVGQAASSLQSKRLDNDFINQCNEMDMSLDFNDIVVKKPVSALSLDDSLDTKDPDTFRPGFTFAFPGLSSSSSENMSSGLADALLDRRMADTPLPSDDVQEITIIPWTAVSVDSDVDPGSSRTQSAREPLLPPIEELTQQGSKVIVDKYVQVIRACLDGDGHLSSLPNVEELWDDKEEFNEDLQAARCLIWDLCVEVAKEIVRKDAQIGSLEFEKQLRNEVSENITCETVPAVKSSKKYLGGIETIVSHPCPLMDKQTRAMVILHWQHVRPARAEMETAQLLATHKSMILQLADEVADEMLNEMIENTFNETAASLSFE